MQNTSPVLLRFSVLALLALHAALLVRITLLWSPNANELGHLLAGIQMWKYGRFDLYRVNPPLTRLVAALPVVCAEPRIREIPKLGLGSRPEFQLGDEFFCENQERAIWFLRWARWACIPFSLLGGYFCYLWARELHGDVPGLVALVLWSFSPNVLCWSATICPDAPAAAMGVTAGYCFWKWLKTPDWWTASVAGVVLGLCELTRTTWIILYALWPLMWLMQNCFEWRSKYRWTWCREIAQIAWLLGLSLLVLNTGYAFQESGKRLGDFSFVSRTLAREDALLNNGPGGNRFADTWLGRVPVPLPANYVQGIDQQKLGFEEGMKSYLCGQWSARGWSYYYLVCVLLKVPVGTLVLGMIASSIGVFTRVRRFYRCSVVQDDEKARAKRVAVPDGLVLLMPTIVVFILVSNQTGISRHFRYVLPVFPFVFIWIGSVFQFHLFRHHWLVVIATLALAWSIASSIWVYPHCMSYFNELAGGPRNGHCYLLDSNIDWQQNLLLLKQWQEDHIEARPMYTLWYGTLPAECVGIESAGIPVEVPGVTKWGYEVPCWQAISVHCLHEQEEQLRYLRKCELVAILGYSIYIYHVPEQVKSR